jgi:predicted dithiol-disulfide oxidoreductase (DUF899 family)
MRAFYPAARKKLLVKEKALTRLADKLAGAGLFAWGSVRLALAVF